MNPRRTGLPAQSDGHDSGYYRWVSWLDDEVIAGAMKIAAVYPGRGTCIESQEIFPGLREIKNTCHTAGVFILSPSRKRSICAFAGIYFNGGSLGSVRCRKLYPNQAGWMRQPTQRMRLRRRST